MRFSHRNPPISLKSSDILVDYDAKNASNPPYLFIGKLQRLMNVC